MLARIWTQRYGRTRSRQRRKWVIKQCLLSVDQRKKWPLRTDLGAIWSSIVNP